MTHLGGILPSAATHALSLRPAPGGGGPPPASRRFLAATPLRELNLLVFLSYTVYRVLTLMEIDLFRFIGPNDPPASASSRGQKKTKFYVANSRHFTAGGGNYRFFSGKLLR
jgi:hypothetical protein